MTARSDFTKNEIWWIGFAETGQRFFWIGWPTFHLLSVCFIMQQFHRNMPEKTALHHMSFAGISCVLFKLCLLDILWQLQLSLWCEKFITKVIKFIAYIIIIISFAVVVFAVSRNHTKTHCNVCCHDQDWWDDDAERSLACILIFILLFSGFGVSSAFLLQVKTTSIVSALLLLCVSLRLIVASVLIPLIWHGTYCLGLLAIYGKSIILHCFNWQAKISLLNWGVNMNLYWLKTLPDFEDSKCFEIGV